jgi:hypothetical protein
LWRALMAQRPTDETEDSFEDINYVIGDNEDEG